MRISALALLVVVAAPLAAAERTDESRAVLAARGSAAVTALLAGDADAALRDFSPAARAQVTPDTLVQASTALRSQLGEPGVRGEPRHGCEGERAVMLQRIAFERAELDAKVSFDADGAIIGLLLVPPTEATPCPGQAADAAPAAAAPALPDGITEAAVTVGAEGWPLDGILTRPDTAADVPAVVLVHGSGPLDADETVFANKPFRDIAHGLAQRGIASVRYVKRTRAHGDRLKRERPDYTIDDETVDDAVAAVRWLREREGIDRDAVFVLGHSLGGLMAPAIGAREPALAGLVLVAGPSRPAEDLLLEQVRYLADSQGITAEQIAQLEAGRQRIKALARGEDVDAPLPLGMSAAWWRSMSAHDPIATARGLAMPMLVLHGGRDYQVTADDFEGWRTGLAGRDDVVFRLYPRLNHLFLDGDAPSMPSEYLKAGHVDEAPIADIAAWITTVRGAD
jgi:dienelactone hydrolase